MQILKGFKYRTYPHMNQQTSISKYKCLIYNQIYNIYLNLQQKQWNANKSLDKNNKRHLKPSRIVYRLISSIAYNNYIKNITRINFSLNADEITNKTLIPENPKALNYNKYSKAFKNVHKALYYL